MGTTADWTAAERLRRAGRVAEAEARYAQIVERAPDFHPAWHGLALLAFAAGDLERAVRMVGRAVRLAPNEALYHRNACELYRRLGFPRQAVAAGIEATRLAPRDPGAHGNLGLALVSAGAVDKARQSFEQALAIDPLNSEHWNNLGAACGAAGDVAGAETAYARAVEHAPGNAEAQNNLGAIYVADGRLDEAARCFEAAIAARPDFYGAHHNLSAIRTYAPDDPLLAELERLAATPPDDEDEGGVQLFFALGKAREDCGDHPGAFAAYTEANRRKHALIGHRPGGFDPLFDHIHRTFTREFLEHAPRAAADARTPIFVIGMPRSGTTLIEQILASHPQVFGAGELKDLADVVVTAPGREPGRHFTAALAGLDEKAIATMARRYLDSVWAQAPGKPYIVDKMPANFLYAGMIHLMFPQAVIVHAMRDPMDSCVSNYTRYFTETMEFAYDLEALGRYYRRYIELMRHWHEVLPAGRILDVHYEELVGDPEGQARRLLAHARLPWDDACLDFFNTRRTVNTASVAQVRRPIYTSSIRRWERFGREELAPLRSLVEPYRDRAHPYGV